MDLGEWLRGLGLGQYEPVFYENGVDDQVLPDLTEADLEKFGVLLGHRKRLLKAIARLTSAEDEPVPGPPSCKDRPEASRRRRAPAADGHVLRSRRVDGARRAARSRGHARDYQSSFTSAAPRLIERNGGFVPNTWATASSLISAFRWRTA